MSETKIIYSDMIEKTIATLSKQGTKIISLTTNIYNFLYKFISIYLYPFTPRRRWTGCVRCRQIFYQYLCEFPLLLPYFHCNQYIYCDLLTKISL